MVERDGNNSSKQWVGIYRPYEIVGSSSDIAPGLFYAWSEKAREKKAECEEGKITLEEFGQWLKEP